MLIDYHIHSSFSGDSDLAMNSTCQRAIELGFKEIAFTDHVDWDWPYESDIIFDIQDMDCYFETMDQLAKKYSSYLTIRKGIEIGLQPHLLNQCHKLVESYPFDFVLGSIHLVNRVDPYMRDYYHNKTKEESYLEYYQQILDIVESYHNFDVLGHLDYVKRYSPMPYKDDDWKIGEAIIDKILTQLIKNNIGIEMNLSGLRNNPPYTMPDFHIIERYNKLGGKILTLGSDTHALSHFGHGFKQTQAQLVKHGITKLSRFNQRSVSFYDLTE